MPRRVYTYLAKMGWGRLNLLASLGAVLIALSVLVFIGNILWTHFIVDREPLWEHTADQPIVTGLRHNIREVLVTNVLDAEPDHRTRLPGPSIWPFITALAVSGLFIGSFFTPWAVPI